MFSSLKVKEFRIYWIGMFLSLIGTWIQSIAQSWLVFQLTNSALLLGFVGFLNSIPILLFSLFGGVLADRLSKRKILIATQTAFMILAFILAVLTQFKLITPLQIMFLAVLNGIVMAFDAPSRQAMVVDLVGRTHLPNAIALNSVSFNSSRIIGPAVGGIMISVIGMSGCFYVNGISFLAVIAALLVIKIPEKSVPVSKESVFKDLKEGLIFVKGNRLVLALISMVGVMSLFGVSYMTLMPVFAHNVLKVGAKGLGILMSFAGLGALLGALILARLGDFRQKGRFLFSSSLIFCISLIVFSLSKFFIFSLVVLIFVGASSVSSVALVNTLLQTKAPDSFRGRLMSVFMITFAGFLPFGNLLAGALSQALGVSVALTISGVVSFISLAIINFVFPHLWEI